MRIAVLTAVSLPLLLSASMAQAAPDFRVQARCIAVYETAASRLEAQSPVDRKRVAKLDAARERLSLALATRTDLSPADAKAGQQAQRAEETRLDGLSTDAVLKAADDCEDELGR